MKNPPRPLGVVITIKQFSPEDVALMRAHPQYIFAMYMAEAQVALFNIHLSWTNGLGVDAYAGFPNMLEEMFDAIQHEMLTPIMKFNV